MVRPIPQALYSDSSAETLTCHLIFILLIHPLHCCCLHHRLHHPPLSCFEFLHAPTASLRPEDEHISLPGPSPAGNSAVLAHGYQKMSLLGWSVAVLMSSTGRALLWYRRSAKSCLLWLSVQLCLSHWQPATGIPGKCLWHSVRECSTFQMKHILRRFWVR